MADSPVIPPAAPPPSAALLLPATLPAGVALLALMQAGVAALRTDLPLALAGEAEAVHRMRTAVRRMRSGLALFAPVLPATATARSRALRSLGKALGPARDWDVFLEETLPAAAADGLSPVALAALRRAGGAERRLAYARMRRRLGGPAMARTIAALLTWSEHLATRNRGPLTRLVRDLAPDLLRRLSRRLRGGKQTIAAGDAEKLHRLRRRIRRLRDATEALDNKSKRRSLTACRRLSERMGAINDATTAATLAARLGTARGAGPAPAALLSDWAAARERRERRRLPRAWRKFRAA